MRTRSHLPALLLASSIIAGCALPRWPVDGTVTSPFGLRHDGLHFEIHRGTDISVPVGTPVHPMEPGRVTFAGVLSGYGNVVILDHGGGIRSLYAHLSEIRVSAGDTVSRDDLVGLSGASGNASGPHLHFEVRRHGTPADPVLLLGQPPRTSGS